MIEDVAESPLDEVLGPALELPRDFTIAREGRRVRVVFLLTAGIVKLVSSVNGRDVLVGIRSRHALLGAAAAICDRRHATTITTLTDCEVRPLSVEALHRVRETNRAACMWLQDRLSAELVDQMRRSATVGVHRHAEVRLALLFVELFRSAGIRKADGSWRLTVGVSVTEMAALAGFGREWTSRVVSRWVRAGAIDKDHGWFVIPARSPFARRLQRSSGTDGATTVASAVA